MNIFAFLYVFIIIVGFRFLSKFHRLELELEKSEKNKDLINPIQLKKEILEFLEANNWMSFGDKETSEKIIDCYIEAYKNDKSLEEIFPGIADE